MPEPDQRCPMNRAAVVERYFMEHRAKVLDIAAFLDRLDRADGDTAPDFRITALLEAIEMLADGQPARARRILEHFSDHTTEPLESAAGMKGAFGVVPPAGGDARDKAAAS